MLFYEIDENELKMECWMIRNIKLNLKEKGRRYSLNSNLFEAGLFPLP
jgi:hypothetical protein